MFEANNVATSANFLCDDTGITRFRIVCSNPILARVDAYFSTID